MEIPHKETVSFGDIWNTLHKVDIRDCVKQKQGLNYISWASAWSILMENYPNSTYEVLDPVAMSDGTVEVWCAVIIEGHTRKMWLPVMDNRKNAIKCPNSRQISDARMRCLVKCMAVFGLGIQLYSGEDLYGGDEDNIVEEIYIPEPINENTIIAYRDHIVASIMDQEMTESDKKGLIVEVCNKMSGREKQAVWSRLSDKDKQYLKDILS